MPKYPLPEEVEKQVVSMRESIVEEIEQMRKQLRIPMQKMGSLIGLRPTHYGRSICSKRLTPMEILLLYRNALQKMLPQAGSEEK